jgi:large subunit ribosomal protein L4
VSATDTLLATRTVSRRTVTGEVLGEVTLAPTIFGIEPHAAVLHQVITAQLAARRAGTQSTKTRTEVRGGGRKPFRQKGTGNARQGTSRSPLMPGGGVALGPKPRGYAQRTPKKMVRLALYSALSAQAAEAGIALIDEFPWTEPRTREAAGALGALELVGKGLCVVAPTDDIATRSFRNLPFVTTIVVGDLNAYDVLNADWVLFTDATLPTGEA